MYGYNNCIFEITYKNQKNHRQAVKQIRKKLNVVKKKRETVHRCPFTGRSCHRTTFRPSSQLETSPHRRPWRIFRTRPSTFWIGPGRVSCNTGSFPRWTSLLCCTRRAPGTRTANGRCSRPSAAATTCDLTCHVRCQRLLIILLGTYIIFITKKINACPDPHRTLEIIIYTI